MAFVIAAPCIADYSCIEICPVNCIGPVPEDALFDAAEQMYIDPSFCISCGACAEVCPVKAIYDAAALPPSWRHYEQINRDYFDRKQVSP
jgi:ferredoxin